MGVRYYAYFRASSVGVRMALAWRKRALFERILRNPRMQQSNGRQYRYFGPQCAAYLFKKESFPQELSC